MAARSYDITDGLVNIEVFLDHVYETDPVWRSEKTNYYLKAQIDALFDLLNPNTGVFTDSNNKLTSSGILEISQGGTGESNRQAALNSLTNISSGNYGDVLKLDPITGNAIWDTPITETQYWDRIGTTLIPQTANDSVDVGTGTFTGSNLIIKIIKPSTDSINAIKIESSSGTNIFNVDTTNNRIGILFDSPKSSFEINGSFGLKTSTISSDTTLNENHNVIFVSGNTILTLPTASTCTNRKYIIKKTDNSATTVILQSQGSDKIDDSLFLNLIEKNSICHVISDGLNWKIIYINIGLSSVYNMLNYNENRVLDANSVTMDELVDFVCTLASDIKTMINS